MPTGIQPKLTQEEIDQIIRHRVLAFKNWMQTRKFLSDYNKWVAGRNRKYHSEEPVGNNEAFWHWYDNGGRDAFNKHWRFLGKKLERRLNRIFNRAMKGKS